MAATAKTTINDVMHELGLLRASLESALTQRDAALAATREFRAERDHLAQEIGQLRQAVRTATGREAAPVVHVQPQRNQLAWEDMYPDHDPAVVEALRYGIRSPEYKAAYRAAEDRIRALQASKAGSPMRPAQYEQNQRMDLAGLPVAPGATFSRDEASGQVHIRYPAERTCELGHPAKDDQAKFCAVCGGSLSAPALGHGWSRANADKAPEPVAGEGDPDKMRDQVAEEMRHERLIEEGVIDPD